MLGLTCNRAAASMSSHDMPPAPSRPRDSNALCLRVYVIMHKRTQIRALNRACVNNGARVVYLLLCWASVSLNACETHDHHKAVHQHCYMSCGRRDMYNTASKRLTHALKHKLAVGATS
jgi:hypothetical protein